ncbi:MAG: IS3 family transposase [Clostridiales bacterium]|nr:IS3 family transposase [Clostridiales bacterium]
MGIEAPAEVKFAMIQAATAQVGNLLSISELCRLAGISRSGYYRWLDAAPVRDMRERQDKADFALIVEAYNIRGYAKGARSIYMTLLHRDIRMNLKKIRRLMNKYGLFCPIRKANPYRRIAKALRTNKVAENVVDRNFRGYGIRKVLLTDITYLPFRTGRCFLSTILDAYTHEILAFEVSMSLKVDFVLDTVAQLIEKHGSALDYHTIVHSDQGFHYTSAAFIDMLRDAEFVQSMSRKGNCWDNAPQESFFGHMKDEIAYELSKKDDFPQVKELVDDWMDYYNNERYQWSLAKLSPREYYCYVTTGFYPLQEYKK